MMSRSMMYVTCLALFTSVPSLSSAQDSATALVDRLFERVVSNDDLAHQRGGAGIGALNITDLEAALHHNSSRATISGDNTVSTGAFTNAGGMNTVIQNSGNNVIIQNATILNLDLR